MIFSTDVATIVNAALNDLMGTLPFPNGWPDSRKRFYQKWFAWYPVRLTDSEKRWAWWETVGIVSDYDSRFVLRCYSQARIAQGRLTGEMDEV